MYLNLLARVIELRPESQTIFISIRLVEIDHNLPLVLRKCPDHVKSQNGESDALPL